MLLRALQKERESRFQSAEAFIAALRAVPEAGDAHTKETVVMQAAPRSRGGRLATAATVQADVSPSEQMSLGDLAPESFAEEDRQARPGQLAVLLLVAALASAGTTVLLHRHGSADAGSAEVELERAAQLLEEGELDRAEGLIRQAIGRQPANCTLHLVLGHIHHRKAKGGDSIEAYGRAIACSARLRNDSTMQSHVIADLKSAEVAPQAMSFLERRVGQVALPALRQAAREHENPEVRRRASEVAQRIASGR